MDRLALINLIAILNRAEDSTTRREQLKIVSTLRFEPSNRGEIEREFNNFILKKQDFQTYSTLKQVTNCFY